MPIEVDGLIQCQQTCIVSSKAKETIFNLMTEAYWNNVLDLSYSNFCFIGNEH